MGTECAKLQIKFIEIDPSGHKIMFTNLFIIAENDFYINLYSGEIE